MSPPLIRLRFFVSGFNTLKQLKALRFPCVTALFVQVLHRTACHTGDFFPVRTWLNFHTVSYCVSSFCINPNSCFLAIMSDMLKHEELLDLFSRLVLAFSIGCSFDDHS